MRKRISPELKGVERDFLKKVAEAGSSVTTLRLCVKPKYAALTIIQQCILLSISRSDSYCVEKNKLSGDRKILIDAIDELYTEQPYLGPSYLLIQKLFTK